MMIYFMAFYLVYVMTICYVLWSFGRFCGILVYNLQFWYVVAIKIRQPWSERVVFGVNVLMESSTNDQQAADAAASALPT
jgi:hypothetical protein